MSLQIDLLAYSNRLRYLPPEHKLGFVLLLIGFSYAVTAPFQLGIAVWLTVWTTGYARIPLRLYAKLLLLPLGFWLLSLPALILGVGVGGSTAAQTAIWSGITVGPLSFYLSSQGLYQVLVLLPRMLALT
ncbi:MAG: cobalt ECF transporter T component CbiQ, partial [Elainella sp.]